MEQLNQESEKHILPKTWALPEREGKKDFELTFGVISKLEPQVSRYHLKYLAVL